MSRIIICDDSDRERWLAERRKKVTASEMNVFLGSAPSFYEDTRETLMARKRDGVEKEFSAKALRRVMHGREREDGILRMLGLLLGYPVVPYHWFISHKRWPSLGATLDGLLFPNMQVAPRLELTSNPNQALEVISDLELLHDPVIVEVKNTDGGHRYKEKAGPHMGLKPWLDFMPDYHREQVQTGICLSGLDQGILVGSLGADDIAAWTCKKDLTWERVLDSANTEAAAELGAI